MSMIFFGLDLPVAASCKRSLFSEEEYELYRFGHCGEVSLESHNIDTILGKQLLIVRRANGLTLSELEDQTGIPAQSLQRYEAGLVRMPSHHLLKVCQVLKIEVSSLLPNSPAKESVSDMVTLQQQNIIGKLMSCSDPTILKRIEVLLSNQQK